MGGHDNYFELGGDSLMATQMVAQLARKTGIQLNPGEFAFQTLGQIAAMLEERLKKVKVDEPDNNKRAFSSLIRSVFRTN